MRSKSRPACRIVTIGLTLSDHFATMRRFFHTIFVVAGLSACLAWPAAAQDKPQDKSDEKPQDRPIRNAPSPRALEFAAYIYSASNVCGYRIGTSEFEAQLAKQNVKPEDVSPRGPFANRIMGLFTLMSNQMVQNREQACLAVAGEYGPEGSLARNVLLPQQGEGPSEKPPAPTKPAQ